MPSKTQSGFSAVISIIAIVLVIGVLGVIGWRLYSQPSKQTSDRTSNSQTTTTSSQTSNQNVFKIPELGVEFDVKNGITPLYNSSIVNSTWNGINYQSVSLSTQQLVDKGASEAKGGNNACSFSSGASNNFPLTGMEVFISNSDALMFEKANSNSHLTAADITPANGFFTIGNKVFSVPQGVVGGLCLQDSSFENQQWQSLHDSLMTLRASQ